MTDLVWYARRLAAMSPSEVLTRVRHTAVKQAWRRRRVPPGGRDPVGHPRPTNRIVGPPAGALDRSGGLAREQLIERADEILDGRFDALGVAYEVDPPDWHLDPVSMRHAPLEYSFSIPIRDPGRTGDVKLLWELSRHHHLTVLAAAYAVTGDPRYAERAGRDLSDWIAANPFLTGVHWTSGIELGIRLVSWTWTRRLLDAWPGVERHFEHDDAFVAQVYRHQQWLSTFFSRGSSSNNHVIAESAGLAISATAFPWFAESEGWRAEAVDLLTEECVAQTFPSGVNRELATEYHGLVLELAVLTAVELHLARLPVPDALLERIEAMSDALAEMVDSHLRPPRQGDGDDGQTLVVDGVDVDRWSSILDGAAALIGPAAWWPALRAGRSVRAVLLDALVPDGLASSGPNRERPDVTDAGLVILRSHSDAGELWCRFDTGAHGYLSISAHAHADALAVEVRVDGVDLLADPGTFAYHGHPAWRRYTRSTIGHNTVELAGEDQSVSGGPFLWSRSAETTLEDLRHEDRRVVEVTARHDGYERLDPPATHRRTVRMTSPAGLEIVDRIDGGDERPTRLAWHLGPAVSADIDADEATLSWTDGCGRPRRAVLELDPSLSWSIHRGETDPPLGWYSPGYGERVPATTLVGAGSAPAVVCHLIIHPPSTTRAGEIT